MPIIRKFAYLDDNGNIRTDQLPDNLSDHADNKSIHVMESDKVNWNAAHQHTISTHAPVNAEVNQNAYSSIRISSNPVSTFAAGPGEGDGTILLEASSKQDVFCFTPGDLINFNTRFDTYNCNELIINVDVNTLETYIEDAVSGVNATSGNSIYYAIAKGSANPDGDWEFNIAKVESYGKQINVGDFIIDNQFILFRVKGSGSTIYCDRIGELRGRNGESGSRIYYTTDDISGTANPDGEWEIDRANIIDSGNTININDIIIDSSFDLYQVTSTSSSNYVGSYRLGGLTLKASNVTNALGYIPADKSQFKTEEWTFELEDGTEVTKKVVLM